MISWLRRTLADPLAIGTLIVNLIPIFAVVVLGWRAVPLVFLYWLENLVLGLVTLARMTATAGKDGPAGLSIMAVTGPFFIAHYGMFCFVHGVFLATFATFNGDAGPGDFFSPIAVLNAALTSGSGMGIFIGLIALWQAAVFAIDYIGSGQYRRTDVQKEMMAPYGHIIVLHVALILGGGLLMIFGEPMVGVLALILLRVAWGVFQDARRLLRRSETAIRS
ncbi:MAG: DUF6498-containing protein [Pseudomonadota bacterium]